MRELDGRLYIQTQTAQKVALLIETSNAYARGVMRGIVSYMREHQSWSVYLSEHSRGDEPPLWLAKWKGHGVIARIENEAIAKAVKRLRVPVVNVSAARLISSLPWVETDDAMIARLAADHLLGRGFKHFGFCGDEQFNWSKWRRDHFQSLIVKAGHQCSICDLRPRQMADSEATVEDIGKWMRSLPKPVGVLACYDFRGRQVLNACRQQGIAVPEEVAVIAVDNDELLCELSDPPMLSVILNTHRTGYEAAALLDRMMSGNHVEAERHLIGPLGIATRQSTDVLAIEDPNMAEVARYIRQHACEGISVRDVLRALPQSRRLMETRFKRLLGRTPHDEILRVRINRVKMLLVETELSMDKIAALAGFEHPEYLSTVFHRQTGLTPSKYRTLNRARCLPASDSSTSAQ